MTQTNDPSPSAPPLPIDDLPLLTEVVDHPPAESASHPPPAATIAPAAEAQLRANAMAGTLDDYELSFEDGEKLRGRFLVQKLDYAGDFNGERNYTLSLESSGAVIPA